MLNDHKSTKIYHLKKDIETYTLYCEKLETCIKEQVTILMNSNNGLTYAGARDLTATIQTNRRHLESGKKTLLKLKNELEQFAQ